MKRILQVLSYLALAATVTPGILVLRGVMEVDTYKLWVLAGTALWFATAPFWINKEKVQKDQ